MAYRPISIINRLTLQFLGSKSNLRTLSRHLAQSIQTQVYTLDLRNHGDSTKIGFVDHSYELMAADVENFLKEQGLDNVILSGHSMYPIRYMASNCRGAKVVLYLALTKPEIPKAVISLENAPISSRLSPTFQQYIEAMRGIEDAKLTKRKEAEEMLAKCEEVFPRPRFPLTERTKAYDNFF
jgi:pimeloyl-ACP methyl ester carboxylesterase